MRFYTSLLSIVLAVGLLAPALAQQPQPAPAQAEDDEEVVRITTNLVQVDAVVTDRDGRQVTNLSADSIRSSSTSAKVRRTCPGLRRAGGTGGAAATLGSRLRLPGGARAPCP